MFLRRFQVGGYLLVTAYHSLYHDGGATLHSLDFQTDTHIDLIQPGFTKKLVKTLKTGQIVR